MDASLSDTIEVVGESGEFDAEISTIGSEDLSMYVSADEWELLSCSSASYDQLSIADVDDSSEMEDAVNDSNSPAADLAGSLDALSAIPIFTSASDSHLDDLVSTYMLQSMVEIPPLGSLDLPCAHEEGLSPRTLVPGRFGTVPYEWDDSTLQNPNSRWYGQYSALSSIPVRLDDAAGEVRSMFALTAIA